MIRRDPSFTGKNDQNGNPTSVPTTASPLTVLRPVTVLPAGSSLNSATVTHGSPVVFLLASPNNLQRLGTPQQNNNIGTHQSGQRVLLLQIPSKSVQQGNNTSNASTPQTHKIVAISAAGSNSVPGKRPMLIQQSSTPNAVPQIYLTRSDDTGGSPPVKRLTLNSPLGSLVRPLTVQPATFTTANLQQVNVQTSTPPIKLVATPVASTAKKGANLVQLEQARSAVRACAAESHSTPVSTLPLPQPSPQQRMQQAQQPPQQQVLQQHPPQPQSQPPTSANRQQAAQPPVPSILSHSQPSTPYIQARKSVEVKTPSIIDQGVSRCINHDRKVVTSQLVPGVRLMPWSRMSEAVLALIPYHIYDTAEPPLVDLLEHDISFAARCQRLLDRKERIQKRMSRIFLDQTSSREKLENIVTDRLLIQSLNEPEEEELEEDVDVREEIVDETAQNFEEMLQSGPHKETPRLVIKFGGEGGCVLSSSLSTTDPMRQNAEDGGSGTSSQFHQFSNNNFDDDIDSLLPVEPKALPGDSPPQFWNTNLSSSNNAASPSLFLSHREVTEESGGGSLSEADLAVQSIL